MAVTLKGVILSVEDVLLNKGTIDKSVFAQVELMMNFFKLKGITPCLLSNQKWTINDGQCLFAALKGKFPELMVFSRHLDNAVPPKPQAASTAYVMKQMGWGNAEALYIGSTENDMRTAVNGGLLFLKAAWYNKGTDYGFEFSEPKQIARFIDTLCLRKHFWSHAIIDGDFEYYCLAPFSTYLQQYKPYSEDARAAAKFGLGHPDFWLSALVTSMYFTGIHKKIDFIAAYPGHGAGVGNEKMNNDLMTFGKCFRKGYLHNLIERHTTALKSQTARNQGVALDHLNQLNTIKLNALPIKNFKTAYKNTPVKSGKTVLLVDDICTKGYSLESARKYIARTGAKTVMVTWLKTINTDIDTVGNLGLFNPYVANNFTVAPHGKTYGYHQHLVDHHASGELGEQFKRFLSWDWPKF
ncbi:phosphoribosyltransferase family protein [Shewanella baltica]|uniref:phosphoribosyltransferase family protein n=1 Tax=Shewanella TaxID=22 RepID=UPI003D7C05A4